MFAGRPCLLVPSPDPDTRGPLEHVLRGRFAAIGHAVPLRDTASSLRWALRLSALTPARPGLEARAVFVDDHLSTLLLLQDEPLAHALAARWLRPLADLTPRQSERLEVTLLAWLEGGGAPEAAKALSVHPQTVRYRMRQLEKLFGTGLRDPRTRFELEMALRSHAADGAGAASALAGGPQGRPCHPGRLHPLGRRPDGARQRPLTRSATQSGPAPRFGAGPDCVAVVLLCFARCRGRPARSSAGGRHTITPLRRLRRVSCVPRTSPGLRHHSRVHLIKSAASHGPHHAGLVTRMSLPYHHAHVVAVQNDVYAAGAFGGVHARAVLARSRLRTNTFPGRTRWWRTGASGPGVEGVSPPPWGISGRCVLR